MAWADFWEVYSGHPFMWNAMIAGALLLMFWRPLCRWTDRQR